MKTERGAVNPPPSRSTPGELTARAKLAELFRDCPIPDAEILYNLSLFVSRQAFARYLLMNELYKKIVDVQGIIIEFGCRWGQNLALLQTLRGIYEPFNFQRKILGFDTFAGFPSVSQKDGSKALVAEGNFSVTLGYEKYLEQVLACQEQESPISQIRKFEVIKGDAPVELRKYLQANPQTIIAFAYFDFDLYEPTKKCLELIKDHLTKGSILGFDELNCPTFPGETAALKEVFGLDRYRIKRSPLAPYPSYLEID